MKLVRKKNFLASLFLWESKKKEKSPNVKHSGNSLVSGDKTDFSVEIFTSLKRKV